VYSEPYFLPKGAALYGGCEARDVSPVAMTSVAKIESGQQQTVAL
jgi:hypothetical protein